MNETPVRTAAVGIVSRSLPRIMSQAGGWLLEGMRVPDRCICPRGGHVTRRSDPLSHVPGDDEAVRLTNCCDVKNPQRRNPAHGRVMSAIRHLQPVTLASADGRLLGSPPHAVHFAFVEFRQRTGIRVIPGAYLPDDKRNLDRPTIRMPEVRHVVRRYP
jgi:hypothetical protein